jgi:DNA integrity scanning protein DisA with diadenylate cyclase activity
VIDLVGTRHRSAYRLCTAAPGALAIVVSQDGGVRFVTHHRDNLMYWDHGPGG